MKRSVVNLSVAWLAELLAMNRQQIYTPILEVTPFFSFFFVALTKTL